MFLTDVGMRRFKIVSGGEMGGGFLWNARRCWLNSIRGEALGFFLICRYTLFLFFCLGSIVLSEFPLDWFLPHSEKYFQLVSAPHQVDIM